MNFGLNILEAKFFEAKFDFNYIVNRSSEIFGTPKKTLIGRTKVQPITFQRFYLWRVLKISGYSYSEIGRYFDRTHGTIIHGYRDAILPYCLPEYEKFLLNFLNK